MLIQEEDKARALAALYNASQPLGLGVLHYSPELMGEEEAGGLLKLQGSYRFDYLRGRVMKIAFGKPGEPVDLDFRLYDRDNGEGAGERAVRAALVKP